MVTCTTPPFRAAVRLNSGVRRGLENFLTSQMRSLSTANIAAIGLVGFCGAFAIYLFKELLSDQNGLLPIALNISAVALLVGVRFLAWPDIRIPRQARISWASAAVALFAVVLAVAARSPQVHV